MLKFSVYIYVQFCKLVCCVMFVLQILLLLLDTMHIMFFD